MYIIQLRYLIWLTLRDILFRKFRNLGVNNRPKSLSSSNSADPFSAFLHSCPCKAATFLNHRWFRVGWIGDVAARLKYNSLVNEGRYSDRIRRLAACILMNSLSNLVFQWRKFLREDKEKTKEGGVRREEERGSSRQRRWRLRRRTQGESAGWTGTGNGCEVAATAAGAPRRPRRGSSWFH